MNHISFLRIVLMLFIVLIAALFLPDFYWKANKHETKNTNVFYSPILKDFLFIKSDVRDTRYVDSKGKQYTREEYESLLPFLNFRQLMYTGKLPQVLDGIVLSPKEINMNNVTLRIRPITIQYRSLQLFPLIETASGRIRLELPPDYFRITARMEFITSMTNELNEEKSALFTAALVKEGFSFPAKSIYGNPSTKKPFDEGYFVIDTKGKVFHIKMVKGVPYCKDTGIPSNLDIVHIAVTENELREFYALVVTKKNEVFGISYNQYALVPIPAEEYDHERTTLAIRGDLFYRVVVVNKENGFHALVTDRNYRVVARTGDQWTGNEATTAGIVASYLFPFTLTIQNETNPYVHIEIEHPGLRMIPLACLSLLLALNYFRKKKIPLRQAGIVGSVIFLTGLYGLIALFAVRDFGDDPRI